MRTITMKMDWSKTIQDTPALKRGQVWCHTCGRQEKVDSAYCLSHGWPKCCTFTMSIDSPEERASRANPAAKEPT